MNGERGSISVLAAALAGVGLAITLLTVDVSRAVLARSRAQAAADASALAAAAELAVPTDRSPSAIAEEYAARGGAVLVECRCDDGSLEAVVTVRFPIRLLMLPAREVTVAARAVVAAAVAGDGPAAAGLEPVFARQLGCLFGAVPGLSIVSGFRTHAEQAALHAEKPDLAAPPGRSLHERGLAADLAFASPAAAAEAHRAAAGCGLEFAVPGEPWHVTPVGLE